MEIKEVTCKSCLTASKLSDYVINPYVGCQHACRYCYAVFMKRFQNISEPWGEFVHVKVNCPDLLDRELKRKKPGHIWMSSVTDCYLPIEKKYRVTRRILEKLVGSPYKSKFTLEILTKSALIRRDFDLLQRLEVRVGCSVNSLDENVSGIIEPTATPNKERINVLKDAQSKGIPVYGFISPVLPGITDLEAIFRELHFCEYVWVELLNTKASVLSRLMPALKQHFPDAVNQLDYAIENSDAYYGQVKQQVKQLEQRYSLQVRDIVRHDL